MTDTIEQLKYPIGRYQRPDSYTADDLKEWINVLKALPLWMDACIENLDTPQLHTPYREGGWTIQQVVHHVADSHMNCFIRLKLALTEENPGVKPYEEALWAELPDTMLIPVNVSVTMIHTLHLRMVCLMQNMSTTDWQKTFHHPQQKRDIDLWELAALYAWHSRHHTEHIMQLRERMNW